MEIKEMTMNDIEIRSAEIEEEIQQENADVETLTAEVEELEARKAQIIEEAEQRKREVEEVKQTAEALNEQPEMEERKVMTNEEIRNSKAYLEAYANYIKTDKDTECRALLTENVSGTVPVPEFVYDIVKTAWERDGITSLVRKSYLKGNLKVGFEISGEDAVFHEEGDDPIDPENLVLGVVNLVPQSIKKAVQISDEVYDLRGEEFLRYIYDEITYRIAKTAGEALLAIIEACGTVSTTNAPAVAQIVSSTASIGLIAQCLAELSPEATNPVIITTRHNWADFKAAQYAGQFDVDPFEGLPVIFSSALSDFGDATHANVIVGDLGYGALMNFPNGQEIRFKFDDLTLKKADLIEVLGRMYVGIGVVAPNAFVQVVGGGD